MFKDQIGVLMEVYVDDMLVKSRKEDDHLCYLRRAFEVMRAYGMKLNPTKYTFGLHGGKFLRYLVSERGIEANPEKIKAIIQLQSPRMLEEVQKLMGARELDVCTDSQLVAIQVKGAYEIRERTMMQYLAKESDDSGKGVPDNRRSEGSASLGGRGSWKSDLTKYLKEWVIPNDPVQAKKVKFKATRFTMIGDELYKRTIDGPLLKCLDQGKTQYVLKEIHEGNCGNHSGGRSLAQKVTRQGDTDGAYMDCVSVRSVGHRYIGTIPTGCGAKEVHSRSG
ncbi:UNVERIFIED_CONTAM: Retrovirus-related Pol polyprotein from transposon gypsy [Sesamum latifolium]|uniref:Retrovirus-related Pol polyprotein from transposon gypsy n=1 Tax=Sesamum latifolium TaxID=2727402 RepID=A0AAW2XI94_9LAMI